MCAGRAGILADRSIEVSARREPVIEFKSEGPGLRFGPPLAGQRQSDLADIIFEFAALSDQRDFRLDLRLAGLYPTGEPATDDPDPDHLRRNHVIDRLTIDALVAEQGNELAGREAGALREFGHADLYNFGGGCEANALTSLKL